MKILTKIPWVATMTVIFTHGSLSQTYAIRIRANKHIMIHPEKSLTFGNSQAAPIGTPNNGQFSIEQYWGGLHFYKDWPTYANGPWKMHLNDLGMLGVNMRAMTRNYTNSWGQGQNQWACYLWSMEERHPMDGIRIVIAV